MRLILTLVMLTLPVLAAAQEARALKTEKDGLSYAMRMGLGAQLKLRAVDVDPAIFARGLRDALSGAKTVLTEDEAKTIIATLQKAQVARQAALAKTVGDKNKAEGDAFLAANKAKPGVATLPSGLQYKILTPGTGKKPTAADTVVCHYRGTLIDGKEFDSSYKRGKPLEFKLESVIKCWTEGVRRHTGAPCWRQRIVRPRRAKGAREALPDLLVPHLRHGPTPWPFARGFGGLRPGLLRPYPGERGPESGKPGQGPTPFLPPRVFEPLLEQRMESHTHPASGKWLYSSFVGYFQRRKPVC